MNDFLTWIFDSIKKETVHSELSEGISIWHPLPYFIKFLGDGLLILWDISQVLEIQQHNLLISLKSICSNYATTFFPTERKKVVDPPYELRCGAAKGTVYSIGDSHDFVGSCINLAARLQKLEGITFAFARRGFNPEAVWKSIIANYYLSCIDVRGLNNKELIYILKEEYERLPAEKRELYPSA